jgi:hypothetical protein
LSMQQHRSTTAGVTVLALRLLHPNYPTLLVCVGTSRLCQLRLNALQQRQRYSIASLARTRIALAVFNGVRYALRRIRDTRVAAIVT